MQVKSNCTGCIHANNIQVYDGKAIEIDHSYKFCTSVDKLYEVLEKTGKEQFLFPLLVKQGNIACEFKGWYDE